MFNKSAEFKKNTDYMYRPNENYINLETINIYF